MNKATKIIACVSLQLFFSHLAVSQIMYQEVTNKKLGIGAYGRVGVDWNFEDGGSIGRRLNLNNMGSIGGRMEEQDYHYFTKSTCF
jgi:maltoporin